VEITLRSGDREVTVRDQRPVLKPAVLAALLAAVAKHMDDEDDEMQAIVLPFGFTGAPDDPVAETGESAPGDGEDRACRTAGNAGARRS
jgi:hypothetical protein